MFHGEGRPALLTVFVKITSISIVSTPLLIEVFIELTSSNRGE